MIDRGIIGNFIMILISIFILGFILYNFLFGNRTFTFSCMIVTGGLGFLYRIIKSILILKFSENQENVYDAKFVLIRVIPGAFGFIIVSIITWFCFIL